MAKAHDNAEISTTHLDVVSGVLDPLLHLLDLFDFVVRNLYPPHLPHLVAQVVPMEAPLVEGLEAFGGLEWPKHYDDFASRIQSAAQIGLGTIAGLREAQSASEGAIQATRAMRRASGALELLYPLAAGMAPVSRFFLPEEARNDLALEARLREADIDRDIVGIMHVENEHEDRGGFSLYVPEYYDESLSWPVVFALHGGTGHGRSFLWNWMREARSGGVIVVSPTSIERTWSLIGPDVDSENLENMLDFVGEHWNIDRDHVLLSGMSDGGTFCYLSGLRAASPFTHLAPIAASFDPGLLEVIDGVHVEGRRIHVIHGALDWMFPVEVGRAARDALGAAGAELVYREIEDLSHSFPRDENLPLLEWFLG